MIRAHQRDMKHHIIVLGMAFASACAAAEPVEPVTPNDVATERTADDDLAAVYPIPSGMGEVRVRSDGADESSDGTIVHAALKVDNHSDRPLALSNVKLFVKTDEGLVSGAEPAARGPHVFPPHSRHEVELSFALPARVSPQDVDAFDLHWALSSAEVKLDRVTSFVEDDDNKGTWRSHDTTIQPHEEVSLPPAVTSQPPDSTNPPLDTPTPAPDVTSP